MTEESKIRDAADAVKGIVQAVPIYQDGLQPAVRQVGIALETIAKTIHIALSPISALVWGYEQVKDFVSTRVAEKLKDVPPERIVTPPPQVAGPVLEALRYTGHDEQLRELYANLLATSLDSETTRNAHPAFVEIIRSMSPDEARILRLFASSRIMPLIDIRGGIKKSYEFATYQHNFSKIGKEGGCDYQDLTPEYLDNLCRLGLMQIPPDMFLSNDDIYKSLEEDEALIKTKEKIIADDREVQFNRKLIQLTSFGLQFCNACVIDKSNRSLDQGDSQTE